MMNLVQSDAWLERAQRVIPGACQTLSKGPTQWTRLPFLSHGQGAKVWDVDGNEYLDLPGALGPVILGHNHPAVQLSVHAQIDRLVSGSTPTTLEVELAELLCEVIPCAEMVRFAKNGSDVTSAAVRLARAVTGRDWVVSIGYHGMSNWSMGASAYRSDAWKEPQYRNWVRGIPRAAGYMTWQVPFNDWETLESAFGGLAAVIMEPVTHEEPAFGYLQAVRDRCTENGTVLIFDEVKTGFRVALGGAQEYYGVTPDLACFGKAMANGYALSALVGKRELMQEFERGVFFSTTFGGETVGLAAGLATVKELRRPSGSCINPIGRLPQYAHYHLEQLCRDGIALQVGVNQAVKEIRLGDAVQCIGHPAKAVVKCRDLGIKTLLQQEMLRQGVLWNGEHMLSIAFQAAELVHLERAYRAALRVVKEAVKTESVERRIEGRRLTEVFRR